MRYVTVRVHPTEGSAFHPIGEAVAADPDITREALHRVELLADGSGVMLAADRGDEGRYREILDASEYVRDYSITASDGRWYSYIHFEPNDVVRRMVEKRREAEYVVEMPVEIRADGSQVMTLIGDPASFSAVAPVEADDWEVELVETGQRPPGGTGPFSGLTERQQEILEVALAEGYYANPRQATHDDIAAALDATASTVGEHLRKVEARVFGHYS